MAMGPGNLGIMIWILATIVLLANLGGWSAEPGILSAGSRRSAARIAWGPDRASATAQCCLADVTDSGRRRVLRAQLRVTIL
jgi:hypothetical protein